MPTRSELAALLQQSEQALASLDLHSTFNLADLHEQVERRRGRLVHLIAQDLPARAPHGLWVAGKCDDYLFYAANASPVRQRLIIGHEYGHMIFDDASLPAELEEVTAALMPSVDPSVTTSMLARSTYDEPIEQRAEVFGTLVVQRAESWSDLPVSQPINPQVSARMISTLEGRRGRC